MDGWSFLPPHDPKPLSGEPAAAEERATGSRRPPVRSRQLARAAARLSGRDRQVLYSLATLHHLTTSQIERLHFREDPRVTPLAATRRTHRCVAQLHHLGLLDRLERRIGGSRRGSAPFIWRLSPAGARVVGNRRNRRMPAPSLQHLAHSLDVAEVVVRLHECARGGPVEITAIETEPACWRQLVMASGGRGWLKPDLRVTLRTRGHELHWFVEVDRGHEHAGALTHKTTRYVAAWREGGEQTRAGVFPRILWIVPDEHRAAAIETVCAATPGAPAGLFVVTTRAAAIDALLEPPR